MNWLLWKLSSDDYMRVDHPIRYWFLGLTLAAFCITFFSWWRHRREYLALAWIGMLYVWCCWLLTL